MTASAPVSSSSPSVVAPVATHARNGLGIAAMCCGLVGILLGIIPLMFLASGALGILAIVFGIVGIRRVSRHEASNRGIAITGLVAGIIAGALAIWGVVIVTSSVNKLNDDLNNIQNAPTSQVQVQQQSVNHQAHLVIHQGEFIGNS